MNHTKIEIIGHLEKIHDEIKRHPFRLSFSDEYLSSYKHLLYEVTNIWCDLIYHCDDLTEEEKKLYRQFGYWIHDYRQELRTHRTDYFPMEYFDYYEQMLQITHRFIDTGVIDTFYNIDCFFSNGKKEKSVEKYQLITKDMCGIDSPELPRFFPVSRKLCVNDEKMKNYFDTNFSFKHKSDEERQKLFENWQQTLKPILVWINNNLVNKTDYEHATWSSV